MQFHLDGLIAAVFTPLEDDGSLNLGQVPAVVNHLESDGVEGLYILGSTGEGVSMSRKERRRVAADRRVVAVTDPCARGRCYTMRWKWLLRCRRMVFRNSAGVPLSMTSTSSPCEA